MPFYRYVDPTYGLLGGSFPGTIAGVSYGRINVTSGGIGGGDGSAIVAPAKVGPPNAGTLFVAFGEQGLSANVNRGLAAVVQNTDILDNVVRENIPFPTYQDYIAADAVIVATLTGDVWTGSPTDDSTLTSVSYLAEVEDSTTGEAIRDSGGNVIRVTHLEYPSGTVQFKQGFLSSGATVRFSGYIPSGTSFRVRYYKRTTLANLSQVNPTAWMGWVMGLFGRTSKTSLHYLWGLNEKYRRATAAPSSAQPDTPGDGAQILRDGQALEVLEPDMDYTAQPRVDPYLALFKATRPSTLQGDVSARKGAIGFLSLSTRTSTGEVGNPYAHADFAVLSRRNVNSNDIGGVGLTLTRVPVGAPVILNPGGTGSSRVSLTSYPTHYWRKSVSGIDRTAIIRNYDLLLITRADGDKQLFIVSSFVNNQILSVNSVTGTSPSFPTNEAATVELIHPVFHADGERLLYLAQPISSGSGSTGGSGPAIFSAASRTRENSSAVPYSSATALAWGGFDDEDGTVVLPGQLRGDGGIEAAYYYGPRVDRVLNQNITTPASATINYDPRRDTKSSDTFSVNVSGTGASTINVLLESALTVGCRITIVVSYSGDANITMNWDNNSGAFRFSGNDGQLTGDLPATYKWEGVAVTTNAGIQFLMTRTDY